MTQQELIHEIADCFETIPTHIRLRTRNYDEVFIRWLYIVIARKYLNIEASRIIRFLDLANHSSVGYALKHWQSKSIYVKDCDLKMNKLVGRLLMNHGVDITDLNNKNVTVINLDGYEKVRKNTVLKDGYRYIKINDTLFQSCVENDKQSLLYL